MEGKILHPPSWFSLNNSETVKVATLAFCKIQLHLIRNVLAKFCIPYSPQSPDIGQNSDGGICNFQIYGQSLIKRNCHNSWTSGDIGMKLEPETKTDKRKKNNVKKIWRWRHVGKLWHHCHFSNLQPIWSNLEAEFSRCIICKTYIFISSNF